MNKDLGALSGSREPSPSSTGLGPSGVDPARDWARLYNGLLSMFPNGRFDDENVAFDLILAGFIESREVQKPCKNCGTPLLDYRYNHITAAGRMFMQVAAIATEAHRAATVEQGAVHEGAGPKDIAQ